ncbi:TPA: hypothetical protein L3939_006553 [Pseudomonas aeruginosa]|nr:hypothetical protein [Pseudomonas aeruginosa]HBN9723519.1 hypothetical protein [Pseudomonas aeruginosa]HBN9771698.1 hypothetical protein [Pseudomonas aeruginosa]HBN9893441.1 hypothetical protein [Pseudomonas aeruginosa]
MPDMREEFEAWVLAEHPGQKRLLARDERIYMNSHIQNRWQAWQASRAALRVELPKSDYADQLDGDAYVMESRAVAEALQQAGIEVK